MGKYLNIIHYFLYTAHYKLHLLANKMNPFNLIHKLPFQKRRYEKLGIDIHKEIDKSFGDKKDGISMMVAGGGLLALLFFFFLSIINLLTADSISSTARYVISGVLSIGLSYSFVFRHDRYLIYINKFDKWTKNERNKYGLITFSFIAIVILLFSISITIN